MFIKLFFSHTLGCLSLARLSAFLIFAGRECQHLGATTLSISTFSITTLSISTFSISTFSITTVFPYQYQNATLSTMTSALELQMLMLSVVMLSVIILSVGAPGFSLTRKYQAGLKVHARDKRSTLFVRKQAWAICQCSPPPSPLVAAAMPRTQIRLGYKEWLTDKRATYL